jgi:iron-sulfur cluster repair protein YtfE (RIC family)
MASVDVFEMELLHRVYRKGFRELADLIEGVDADDTLRSDFVGAHIDFFLVALHHHHAAEDEVLWPKLHARVPLHQTTIKRIEDQHREIATSVDSLRRILAPWTATPELGLRAQLAAGAQKLSHQIDEHLAEEEQNVVPMINEQLTPPEWQEFLDLGSSFLSEDNLKYGLVLAGMIHDAASPQEWERFIAGAPIFVQYLWNERGNYTYAKYTAELNRSPG